MLHVTVLLDCVLQWIHCCLPLHSAACFVSRCYVHQSVTDVTSIVDEINIYSLSIFSTCLDHIWSSSVIYNIKNDVNIRHWSAYYNGSVLFYTTFSSRYEIVNYIKLNISISKFTFPISII
jgi:hypothetical protein